MWNKSTYCDTGQCLEVEWQRSSFCGEAGCLEISWKKSTFSSTEISCLETSACPHDGHVLVRNSTTPDVDPVSFTPDEWRESLAGIKADWPVWDWFRGQDVIIFTDDEAAAFKAGVLAGEFEYEKLIDRH